jgi:hypothetical protein
MPLILAKREALLHGRTVWGVQEGITWLQDACPAGRPPSGVACPQGVKGLGMVGPDETFESPWPPLAYAYVLFKKSVRNFRRDQVFKMYF